MSMAESYEGEPQTPQVPEDLRVAAGLLVAYLSGQLSDARAKEGAENYRGDRSAHGSFVQKVPIEVGHMLTRGSERVVLKPPHPHDSPGTYCEVYAVAPFDPDLPEATELLGERFLVRESLDGQVGPFRLVDESGVHQVDVQDVSHIFDHIDVDDPLKQYDLADELLARVSTYNIVASQE